VQELSVSAPGLGGGNDFADLSVNRSKLLLERSHALINVRLGCAISPVRFGGHHLDQLMMASD
jgi:hypothetical protein